MLSHESVKQNQTPLLVFCNKADLSISLSAEQISATLERELCALLFQLPSTLLLAIALSSSCRRQQLRETAKAAAGQEDAPDIVKPGKEAEPFVFANAVSPVTFASGSARTGQVEPVSLFIRNHCL